MAVAVKAWWAAFLAAPGLVLAPTLPKASAAEGLRWAAPAGCPSAQAVRDALAKLSAHPSAGNGVTVEVARNGNTWGAHVTTGAGTRHIQGESCQAVADAVVVVLSLAEGDPEDSSSADTDGRAAASRVAASVELAQASARTSPATPPRTAVPDNAPPPPAAATARGFSIGAAVLTEVGLLPAPSLGPRLELAVSSDRWAIEAAAAALLPRRARLTQGGTARADLHWLGGQIAVCRTLRPLLRACAGGELGEVVGVASGVDRARTASGLWVAATAGVALRAPLGATPLHWQAGAGVAWALLRPQFGFDDLGVLHQASQASGRLWLGLVWN